MSHPTEYLWSQSTHRVPWENICPEGVEHHTLDMQRRQDPPSDTGESNTGYTSV